MGYQDYRQGYSVRLPDRRADPRYSVDENAVVQVVGSGLPMPGAIIDLSQEGCRVRTREQVLARARRPVEVMFKINGVAFRLRGVVEWADSPNILGIRFVNVAPERMSELAEVLGEMAAAAAARAEAVNKLVAQQEPPAQAEPEAKAEVKESAGRQNREPPVIEAMELPAEQPAATATPAASGHENTIHAKPSDRRGQVRHQVDTSAKILLVNVGSVLRGKILDLSLSGCRIRTDERFPVGIYTRVEVEFRLEGLPFRLGGVVQAIHGRYMVGIRFLDLSERKRKQVVELIGEIQQTRAAQSA